MTNKTSGGEYGMGACPIAFQEQFQVLASIINIAVRYDERECFLDIKKQIKKLLAYRYLPKVDRKGGKLLFAAALSSSYLDKSPLVVCARLLTGLFECTPPVGGAFSMARDQRESWRHTQSTPGYSSCLLHRFGSVACKLQTKHVKNVKYNATDTL